MKLKQWLLCGIMLGSIVAGRAQQKALSLQDCVETGIKNNLEVLRASLDAEVAKANWQQAKANLYPDLNASATHGTNRGRSIDPFTNQYINQNVNFANYSLSSSVVLFNGLRLMNTVKQTLLGVKAAESDFQQQKDALTIRIILAYLEVLRNQDQLVQARNQAALSEKQVERLDELNKQGAIAPSLLTDLRGDFATNQLTILEVSNALETARIALAQLMNVPYSKTMTLEPLDPAQFALDYRVTAEQIYAGALEKFAQIKASEYRVASAEKGVKAAKGWLFPELSLNGNVNTNYSSAATQNVFVNQSEKVTQNYVTVGGTKTPLVIVQDNFRSEKLRYGSQLDNNLFNSLNLNLRIPIFNGLQAKTRVKLAAIDLKNNEYELNTARVQLQQAIEQAYTNMTTSLERYKTLVGQVDAYTQSYQAAEIRFNAGVGTSVDYLTAKNNLDRSRINLIQARYDYALRTKVLDFYQGIRLY